VQFTLEMHVAAQNCKKFTKTPYFGGLRSFKVIDVDISKKHVASACYDKQHTRLVVLESGLGLESGLKSVFAGLGLGL